jgi:hypothetical protein
MKKLLTVLLGVVVVAGLLSAHVFVNAAKTGTYEFFGSAATKPILTGTIEWGIGVLYKAGDYLKFTLPTNWSFGTPGGSLQYYLVAKTSTGPVYTNDINGDGTVEWAFFSGGPTSNFLQFRVNQNLAPYFTSRATTFYIATVASSAALSGIPVNVKGAINYATADRGNKIQVDAIDNIAGTNFDGTPLLASILDGYLEYAATFAPGAFPNNTIEVATQRKQFQPAPYTKRAGGNFITVSKTARDYCIALNLMATDYFTSTVTPQSGSDLAGISYGKFFATTKTPAGGTIIVPQPGNVPGATGVNFGTATSAMIVVDGTTPLSNRALNYGLVFAPAVASNYMGVTLVSATKGFEWNTNGTVFRSVWFSTAISSGDLFGWRIANHSTVAADVWADVWLDDGQKTLTTAPIWCGNIAAGGIISIRAYDMCATAGSGIIPTMVATGQSYKGRVIFTVWAPPDQVFGTGLFQTAVGYSEIALEKQTNGTSWWEK